MDSPIAHQVDNVEALSKALSNLLEKSLTGLSIPSLLRARNENVELQNQLRNAELKVQYLRNQLQQETTAKLQVERNLNSIQRELSQKSQQLSTECNISRSLQAEKDQIRIGTQQLQKDMQKFENERQQFLKEKQDLSEELARCRSQMETVKYRVFVVFTKRGRVRFPLDVYPWTTYSELAHMIDEHRLSYVPAGATSYRLYKLVGAERLWLHEDRSLGENQVRAHDELHVAFLFPHGNDE